MAKVHYLVGDATSPVLFDGKNVIVHCCNTIGAWGAGFVIPLAAKYPQSKKDYQKFISDEQKAFKNRPLDIELEKEMFSRKILGRIAYTEVSDSLGIANLIGQDGIYSKDGQVPIRYEALRTGFSRIINSFKNHKLTIHCPRIGAGLAGGIWSDIEKLLIEEFVEKGVDVYVYDLPGEVRVNKWVGTKYETI